MVAQLTFSLLWKDHTHVVRHRQNGGSVFLFFTSCTAQRNYKTFQRFFINLGKNLHWHTGAQFAQSSDSILTCGDLRVFLVRTAGVSPTYLSKLSTRMVSWRQLRKIHNESLFSFRRPLCRCNQGFRRWRPGRSRTYKDPTAEWSQDLNDCTGPLVWIWLEKNCPGM